MSEKSELENLSDRIDMLQQLRDSRPNEKKDRGDIGFGISLLSQFGSALVVGLCIGMFLDKILSTSHIFLIIFLVFGVFAGFLNCYRFEKLYNEKRNKRIKG